MDELKYYLVMMDEYSGMATVCKTNVLRSGENYFTDQLSAVIYAKNFMDDWLKDKIFEINYQHTVNEKM